MTAVPQVMQDLVDALRVEIQQAKVGDYERNRLMEAVDDMDEALTLFADNAEPNSET